MDSPELIDLMEGPPIQQLRSRMDGLTILSDTMSSSETPSPSSVHSSEYTTECSSNSPIQKRRSADYYTEPSAETYSYTKTSWLDLTPDEPFNFLGLPKEIRLMIYEQLPQKIIHQFVLNKSVVEVTDKCCNTAILSTCRFIHDEAHQILFNSLQHNGPRLHLILRGLNVDHLLLVCDKLSPNRPIEQSNFRDPSDKIGEDILSRDAPFDFSHFELRSYMRTPKDYHAHIDWVPSRPAVLSTREYLARFVWVLGRLYCIVANQFDYTVSIWDGKAMVPILDFMNRKIPRDKICGSRFHDKLSRDGFSTWRHIICRPHQRCETSMWLWRHR